MRTLLLQSLKPYTLIVNDQDCILLQADEDPVSGTQNGATRADAKVSNGTPPKAAASAEFEDRDVSSMLELLQNLSQLSTELQKDAEEDDEIFREGGSD